MLKQELSPTQVQDEQQLTRQQFCQKKKKKVRDYIGPQAGHGQKHHAVVKKADFICNSSALGH